MVEEISTYSLLDAEKERLRQTERQLDEMGAAALAADQRAVQFCSALGVMITIAAQIKAESKVSKVLQVDSLFALFIALALASYSFRPKVATSSGSPAFYLDSYCTPDGCEKLLAELARRNDEAIARSKKALGNNGRHFADAMTTAAIGIALLAFQILLP